MSAAPPPPDREPAATPLPAATATADAERNRDRDHDCEHRPPVDLTRRDPHSNSSGSRERYSSRSLHRSPLRHRRSRSPYHHSSRSRDRYHHSRSGNWHYPRDDRYREDDRYAERYRSRDGHCSRSASQRRDVVDVREVRGRPAPTADKAKSSTSGLTAEQEEVTVLVSQIHPSIVEEDLFDFFSLVGQVNDIRLIRDPRTNKSRGLCYVEFDTAESVQTAIALSGQQLGGYPINITGVVPPGKKAAASKAATAATNNNFVPMSEVDTTKLGEDGPLQLYIGHIAATLNEADLKPVFEAFGDLLNFQFHYDPATKLHKGYGFVYFRYARDALLAMHSLNGIEIAGRPIRVAIGSQGKPQAEYLKLCGPGTAFATLDEYNNNQFALAQQKNQASAPAAGQTAAAPASQATYERLEDDHIRMDSAGRAALMQKLAGNDVTIARPPPLPSQPVMQPPPLPAAAPVATASTPTPFLLLSHMFNPAEESGTSWPQEIEEDTREEAAKSGAVRAIHLDAHHPQGLVYLQMSTIPEAVAVREKLHGRWFAGRQIQADFMLPQEYVNRFPNG